MTIYTAPNLSSGIDNAIIETASSVQALPLGLLLFTFFVVLIGGTASQNRRQGYADFPMWTLLASLSCLMLALLMTMKAGIIGLDILGIVVAINILSALWFFISKGKGEV